MAGQSGSPISDPAAAVAASKCYMARTWRTPDRLGETITAHHPGPCEWEEFPADVLVRFVAEWVAAGGFESAATIAFSRMPAREQRDRVRMAQYGVPLLEART